MWKSRDQMYAGESSWDRALRWAASASDDPNSLSATATTSPRPSTACTSQSCICSRQRPHTIIRNLLLYASLTSLGISPKSTSLEARHTAYEGEMPETDVDDRRPYCRESGGPSSEEVAQDAAIEMAASAVYSYEERGGWRGSLRRSYEAAGDTMARLSPCATLVVYLTDDVLAAVRASRSHRLLAYIPTGSASHPGIWTLAYTYLALPCLPYNASRATRREWAWMYSSIQFLSFLDAGDMTTPSCIAQLIASRVLASSNSILHSMSIAGAIYPSTHSKRTGVNSLSEDGHVAIAAYTTQIRIRHSSSPSPPHPCGPSLSKSTSTGSPPLLPGNPEATRHRSKSASMSRGAPLFPAYRRRRKQRRLARRALLPLRLRPRPLDRPRPPPVLSSTLGAHPPARAPRQRPAPLPPPPRASGTGSGAAQEKPCLAPPPPAPSPPAPPPTSPSPAPPPTPPLPAPPPCTGGPPNENGDETPTGTQSDVDVAGAVAAWQVRRDSPAPTLAPKHWQGRRVMARAQTRSPRVSARARR
ncbi:hypothetical protein B0H14DRAFT_332648 [Mycena olivaceomarginata]|nr:hypothetical protein B0H14DRAFT_332648 [Mycena olivaceomarginata]